MSYLELIPAGALDREWDTPLDARDLDHERVATCTECGAVILVCGHVADIDPNRYRGVFCCWVDRPEDWRQ